MLIRRPSLSPVAWLTIGRVTQQALSLALIAVLAPILGPRPFGSFAIVMVFIGFCELILIEGAAEALMTVETLDHRHTTTANLVNCAIAGAFGIVVALMAPFIGTLYEDPELTRIAWALIPLPLISALSITPIAVLRRSMQFRRLTIRSIIGLTIGGAVGVVLAVAGAGVWALAMQALAQRIAETLTGWLAVPVRIGFQWSKTHFDEMRPIAVNVFAARLMIFVGGQLPRVILGYVVGTTELGFFAMANRFFDIIVTTTVLPSATVGRTEMRESKPGSATFTMQLATMTRDAAMLSFPLFLGAAALVPDLFQIWFRGPWLPGTTSTQLILLGGPPYAFYWCIDAALLAANLSSVVRRQATIQALTILATVLILGPFGLKLTCLGLTLRSWVLLPFFLFWARHSCQLPLREVLRLPLRSFLGGLVMAALLTMPQLRPIWVRHEIDFVFLVLLGMATYGAFLHRFSRGQLRAALAMFFIHRS
jgi:O-antigen/teichoic acid export membrane protein